MPVLFLFLYLGVSLLSLQRPFYEGWLALARLILWTGLVWTLTQLKREELRMIAGTGLFSAALIAVGSFLKLWGVSVWPSYPPNFVPPIGYLPYYGEFMVLHIPFALLFFLRSAGFRSRIFYAALFFVLLGGIAVSASRTSLLAAILGTGLGAVIGFSSGIFKKRAILRACLLLLVIPLIILAIPTGFRASMSSRLGLIGRESAKVSLTSRILGPRAIQYSKAYKMLKERPWRGWGLGSFRFNYPLVAWQGKDRDLQFNASTWVMHPHNEFLHQAVEVGVFGALLFALFWLSIFSGGVRSLRSPDRETDRLAVLAGLTGLFIAAVTWQLNTNFLFPLSRLLTGLYLAIIWREASPRRGGVEGARPIGIYVALITMILATLFIAAYQLSLYATVKAQRSRSETERVQWVERGYRLAPGAFDPLILAAADGAAGLPIPDLEEKMTFLEEQYPHVPMALFLLGRHEMQRGRNDRAIELLQEAFHLYPNFNEAGELLNFMGVIPDAGVEKR